MKAMILVSLLLVSTAYADDSLTEVVVTSSRQGNQSLQSIPMSITVVNPDVVSQMGASSLTDIAPLIPSLSIEQSGSGLNKIDMRGISTGPADVVNNLEDRPLVAVYIDDTPLAMQGFNPDIKVFDIDRLEVLRGPQGTLYGASAMGGTIRYITKKPDASDLFGSSELTLSDTVGGGINYGARGSVNLPLSADTAVLLTGYNGRNSGWIDNAEIGTTQINWDRSTQGRIALRYKADQLTLDASVLFEKLDTGGSNYTFSQLSHNQFYSMSPTPINDDMKVYNITGEYVLDFGKIISSTSYMNRNTGFNDTGEFLSELFYGLPAMATPYVNQNRVSQFSQEVRVISNQNGQIKWVAGGFFNHLVRNDYQDDNGPGFDQATDINSVSLGAFRPDSVFSGTEDIRERDLGIFGEVTWSPIKRLSLTTGLRYFTWQQHFNLYFGGAGGAVNGEPSTVDQSASAHGFNPRFNISYELTDSTMMFVEAAKGFRYGGVNQAVPNASNLCGPDLNALGLKSAPISYGPDHLWSYSLGEKTTLDDNKIRLNATAFVIKWNDVQTSHYLPSCSYAYTQNAGAVQSTGIELEAAYKVTSQLTFSLNASYTHAVADGSVPNVGAVNGDRTPYFPQYLGSATADYVIPVRSALVRFTGEYQYHGNSATRFDVEDPSYRVLPAYSNVNVAANLEFSSWQVGAFVRNLSNSAQITMIAPDVLGVQPGDEVAYARPRTIGLRIAHQF